VTYALCASPAVRREEKVQLDAQREAKNQKQTLLREKKMLACQKEYANKLMYIEMAMANSPAFWKTVTNAKNEYKKLESNKQSSMR
jgi:hypothetical protein